MKKLLILLSFITLGLTACSEPDPPYISEITSVQTDSMWQIQKTVTHTNHSNGGAITGGVLGGTAGWLLVGGPIAIIGGTLIGATVGSNPQSESYTETVYETHYRYINTCSNGHIFKTVDIHYNTGTKIDTRDDTFYYN